MPNTVSSQNFNTTMFGYVRYALKFAEEALIEKGYTEDQTMDILDCFLGKMYRAIDDKTMSEAREIEKTASVW